MLKLEECEQQLQIQLQRRDADAERLADNVKALGAIRAGVEHLAGKLQDTSLVNHRCHSTFTSTFRLTVQFIFVLILCLFQMEDKPFKSSPTSDEFVLELLNQCDAKLQILLKELEGMDMASVMKEIEEDEVSARLRRRNIWHLGNYFPLYENKLRGSSSDFLRQICLGGKSDKVMTKFD